ncbi:MAG TPA: amidohydrolase family protein, partial [Chloroflexota bacterium]|nr:amidohydrolase family protein [Chloroflexota bacterium]
MSGGTVLRGIALTPSGFQRAEVRLEHGRIADVLDAADAPGGLYILPGLVDAHIHGAGGSQEPARMAQFLPTVGVTAFVPTVATSSREDTLAFVAAVAELKPETGAAEVLGSHLEGPFLSPHHCGAHTRKHLRLPDLAEARDLLAAARGTLRRMTLAPELRGAGELIELLAGAGVLVSLGHSACSYEQALRAAARGATSVTHAYNAMATFHHRAPGLVGAAFTDQRLRSELIADGVHVHSAAALALIRSRGSDGVAIVSDGLPALGMQPGEYTW